jgi:hypothetical protein
MGRNTVVVLLLVLLIVGVGILGWWLTRPLPIDVGNGGTPVADDGRDSDPLPLRAGKPGVVTGEVRILATQEPAAEIIDPRPHLKGLLNDTFEQYPNIGKILPAMGYSDQQIEDLESSINDSDADLVIVGTPINLGTLIKIDKPYVWARYDLEYAGDLNVGMLIDEMLEKKGAN